MITYPGFGSILVVNSGSRSLPSCERLLMSLKDYSKLRMGLGSSRPPVGTERKTDVCGALRIKGIQPTPKKINLTLYTWSFFLRPFCTLLKDEPHFAAPK